MPKWLGCIGLTGIMLFSNTGKAVEFLAHTTYPAGTAPSAVSFIDLSWSNKVGLLVANQSSNDISVFRTDGSGAYFPYGTYSVGVSPVAVIAEDFNGDQDSDIAVANQGSSNVSVLVNRADGTFDPAVNYAVGTAPSSIAQADFNSDGMPDLAVSNQGSDSVSVLLNGGAGTFLAASSYAVGASPSAVYAALVDADIYPDLIVTNNADNTVSVLLNNGGGSFLAATSYVVGNAPVAVYAANMDTNALLDLVVANQNDDTVSVLFNDGSGAFLAPVPYAVGSAPSSVTVFDLDGDGYGDILTANRDSNTVSVLLNDRSGGFENALSFAVGTNPLSIASADIDYDDAPDLLLANSGSDNISILQNSTDYTPDAFTFFDVDDALVGEVIESNAISITGLDEWAAIAISVGEYAVSIDSGDTWSPWSSSVPVSVAAGHQVKVRRAASLVSGATVFTVLTLGGVEDTFSITSIADDEPDPFTFISQTNVPLDTVIISNAVTITGIAGAVKFSVIGGEISVNGGAFRAGSVYLYNNSVVRVRLTSPALNAATTQVVVGAGSVAATFQVTTLASPLAQKTSDGGGVLSTALVAWLLLLLGMRLFDNQLHRRH